MSSGSAGLPADLPLPGDIVAGHFRVERVLGSGGMGVVLAATDLRSNREVAVKLLRGGHEQRQLERFFREARTMGRLSTPHVVKVFEAGGAEDKPFLVMERLEGLDLAALTKQRGVLTVREVADCMIQACEALSHAHASGIVHRDVKPSNLFLHEEPGRRVLKVLDFGISKVIARDAFEHTLTSSTDGGVLGSPPYMSPEQVRDPRKVDPRTDIWSLGIVMYKLLAGRLPFDGESVGEVFARILERRYPSLLNTVDVPKELDAVVARCLAKDRRERFSHVGELAMALAPFASPEIAAIAPPILVRLRDEERTVEFSDMSGPSLGVGPDAGTLTVDDPPYAAPSSHKSFPPPSPVSYPGAMPHSPSGEVATSSGAASTSIKPPAPTGGRSWIAFALLGLGIASGVLIGFGFQKPPPQAPAIAAPPPPATETAPAPPPTATVQGVATAEPTTAATANAPAKQGPTAKPSGTTKGKKPAAGATTAATTGSPPPPATTARPELQANPYGAP